MKFKQIAILPGSQENHFGFFAINEDGEIWIHFVKENRWIMQQGPNEKELQDAKRVKS